MVAPRLALLAALCLAAPHPAAQQQPGGVARGGDAAQAQGRQRQVHRIIVTNAKVAPACTIGTFADFVCNYYVVA